MSQFFEILQWLVYNSFIPLLPVPLVWLGAWLLKLNRDLLSILSGGQLCFYCTAISAAAIRDIVLSSSSTNQFAGISVGIMIVLMIFSTFLYGVALILVEIDKDNLTSSYRLAWLSISAAITTTI